MLHFRFKNTYFFLVILMLSLFIFYGYSYNSKIEKSTQNKIITGANQMNEYLPLLKNKRVAVLANQTSVVEFKVTGAKGVGTNSIHLVDFLQKMNVDIKKVFAPEHGFRGRADAGEHVADGIDTKTDLPVFSLFGKNRKPKLELLDDVDIVIFDIQDVGVRFYTYISTMSNMMEACAEKGIPMLILDRPNPNGHYIDGPTLEPEHSSFVGLHPIPLVYGMTIGEYAKMVNGEKWLKDGIQCDINIITLKNYDHQSEVHLPIRPSPNLPNDKSINLYPSLGFFEGTIINAGRGTEFQFQRYGAPFFPENDFNYTPKPNFGSKYPKFDGEKCYGIDLSKTKKLSKVDISFLVDAYQKTPKDKAFFGKTFTVHAGTLNLQQQLESGLTAKEISASWQKDLEEFKKVRVKYLLYE